MTAYEVYQFTSNNLQNIADVQAALAADSRRKVEQLPPHIQAKLTPEYIKQMQTAQARAIAQIEIELKQWYE